MQYYPDILRHENSITIKAIKDKANSDKIIYHSVYLNHIISKECGVPFLPPQECCHLPLFHFPIMIISPPGSDSCFTKMKICPIRGLLISTKNLTQYSPSGSSTGGLSLVQLLKIFPAPLKDSF